MGTDPSAAGAPLGADMRSPEEIRESIAQTREELGDTVAALAAKTDVKARAKEKAALVKAQGSQKLRERLEGISRQVRANPRPAAIGAAATAGLLVWRLRRR